MVSTMSAAAWSSRSSRSSHILRKLARIGAFSDGSRSIRVRAMQNAMPSAPILVCSTVGLLMAGSFSGYGFLGGLLGLLFDQNAGCGWSGAGSASEDWAAPLPHLDRRRR